MDASEKKILEKRLENWSAWAREGKPVGTSSLLGIMREGGWKPDYGEKEKPRVIDIRDAMEVEAAWASMADTREKRILQEVYGHPTRPLWASCKKAQVKVRGYEHCMMRAKEWLNRILNRSRQTM